MPLAFLRCGKFAALTTELARNWLQSGFQTGAVDWWCLDTLDIIEREGFYPGKHFAACCRDVLVPNGQRWLAIDAFALSAQACRARYLR